MASDDEPQVLMSRYMVTSGGTVLRAKIKGHRGVIDKVLRASPSLPSAFIPVCQDVLR
jgi:hypothetical protein